MTNPVQYSELDKFLPAEDDLIEFFGSPIEPEDPFLEKQIDDADEEDDWSDDEDDDEDDSDDEDDEDFED